MNKVTFAVGQGVRLCNCEAGACDCFCNTKTGGKTAGERGFASTNIANKFDDTGWFNHAFGEVSAEIKHFLFRMDNHTLIIALLGCRSYKMDDCRKKNIMI